MSFANSDLAILYFTKVLDIGVKINALVTVSHTPMCYPSYLMTQLTKVTWIIATY